MTILSETRLPRSAEWVLLIAIVIIAIVFRFAQFGQVPPGLHYDEAIDARLAQQIRSGAWPIYFEEGWGREPLYHYLVAFALNFVSDPTSALRLMSSLLGLTQLLAAYFLLKQMFGVPTALIGAAWIAVLFWTVSTSRAGLRNITLTTLATLTALAFAHYVLRFTHRASQSVPGSAVAGLLLGLTLYTYQPSRVVPLIYLAFITYLFFKERPVVRARWKSIAVFFLAAAVVFLPLGAFLATHPDAETGRAFQTEPIRALLSGEPGQVAEAAIATLRMFTFDGGGDPQPIYNVPGRPLFVGIGAILFYLGLLACLARWRQPAYAFVLIWLFVTLLPNMLTAPAPFFYRAIAAQTPVLALPAIGTVALGDWVRDRVRLQKGGSRLQAGGSRLQRGGSRLQTTTESASGDASYNNHGSRLPATITMTIAIISLGQTAWTTQHDYFVMWGSDPGVRFQYSAAHTAIARVLDESADASPVAVSGYFAEDADPYIFEQTLRRRDLAIRWFDARSALAAIGAATDQRLALPSFTPLDESLAARFLPDIRPIAQTGDFALYTFDVLAFGEEIDHWSGRVQTPDREATQLPVLFGDNLLFLGYERPAVVSRRDSELVLHTAWRVTGEGQPPSTAIFAHLIDANDSLAAQDDRLGFPRHTWQAGDRFVQVHRIPLGNLPPGTYTLQIGLYTRSDGARWPAHDAAENPIGDRVLLGEVEVRR